MLKMEVLLAVIRLVPVVRLLWVQMQQQPLLHKLQLVLGRMLDHKTMVLQLVGAQR